MALDRPPTDGRGSGPDESSPIDRRLQVQQPTDQRTGPVDLGAVSIGLFPVVLVLLAVIAGPMPNWLRLSTLAIAIILGTLVAGYSTATTGRAASQNGMGVVVAATIVMGATWVSIDIGTGQVARIPLVYVVHLDPVWMSPLIVLIGILLGGSIGLVGHRIRFRDVQ